MAKITQKLYLTHSTDKSIQIAQNAEGTEGVTWLPRSLVSYMRTDPPRAGEEFKQVYIEIPGWKAEQLGLAYD